MHIIVLFEYCDYLHAACDLWMHYFEITYNENFQKYIHEQYYYCFPVFVVFFKIITWILLNGGSIRSLIRAILPSCWKSKMPTYIHCKSISNIYYIAWKWHLNKICFCFDVYIFFVDMRILMRDWQKEMWDWRSNKCQNIVLKVKDCAMRGKEIECQFTFSFESSFRVS